MKTQILLGFGLYLLSPVVTAQSKLKFNYDQAGNQIKYSYCKGADCDQQRNASATEVKEELDDLVVGQDNGIIIFPNPATHLLYVQWGLKNRGNLNRIDALDVSGKRLQLAYTNTALGAEIDLNALSKGIYFIVFSFDDSTQFTQKVLKN